MFSRFFAITKDDRVSQSKCEVKATITFSWIGETGERKFLNASFLPPKNLNVKLTAMLLNVLITNSAAVFPIQCALIPSKILLKS